MVYHGVPCKRGHCGVCNMLMMLMRPALIMARSPHLRLCSNLHNVHSGVNIGERMTEIHVHVHVKRPIYIYIYVHVHVKRPIYICTCTYKETNIYIYVHVHVQCVINYFYS